MILKKIFTKESGLLIGLILSVVVFYFDYITGPYLGLSMFYIGSVFFATWRQGVVSGIIISVASAVFWLIADLIAEPHYPSLVYAYWNSGVRLSIFLIVAYSVWRIEAAKKMRRDFINFVVHDLRNPLSSMLLLTENLRRTCPVNNETKQCIDDIVNSGKQLSLLIDSMLDLSRLEDKSSVIKLSDVGIKDLMDKVKSHISIIAQDAGIKIATDITLDITKIYTNSDLIIRILINLVTNAIKASPTGATVTIRFKGVGRNMAAFSVIDQGQGIPKDVSKEIFNQFVSTRLNNFGMDRGFGLGLKFCKVAVENLKGRITVKSEMGKGSEFTFKLPTKKLGLGRC
ncbi:MAG: HAMP domain-containing histidine kinase [Candidatus Omnitrophica bacterium]|nr:HAMP domain-containing histidine kinase [Candidatus Omnitrophota bacterium]